MSFDSTHRFEPPLGKSFGLSSGNSLIQMDQIIVFNCLPSLAKSSILKKDCRASVTNWANFIIQKFRAKFYPAEFH